MKSAFETSGHGRRVGARGLLAVALAAACVGPACDVPADVDTRQGEVLWPNNEIYVGFNTYRQSRGSCPSPPCATLTRNILYTAVGGNDLVAATPDFPDNPSLGTFYQGCGPKAAQNVLAYFGVKRPITGIPSPPYYVKTMRTDQWSLYFQKGIATLPDDLVSGLQRALNELADGQFKVTRKQVSSPITEIKKQIDAGFPIIVLAQDGSHYLMVTGYDIKKYTLWINDYTNDNGSIQAPREVDYFSMKFNVPSIAAVLGNPGNWRSNTVITTERAGGMTHTSLWKSSDAATVYSLNWIKACSVTWDQYVALGYPGYTTMTPTETQSFLKANGGTALCTNGEAGLPNWGNGLYKASDNATIYSLRGAKACFVTWPQYVAQGQPAFTTLQSPDMARFKNAYGGASVCPN